MYFIQEGLGLPIKACGADASSAALLAHHMTVVWNACMHDLGGLTKLLALACKGMCVEQQDEVQCCAGLSPQQVLQSNTDRWMMISNSLVSLDGTVCNMIGTSYPAFRYQSVRPTTPTPILCHATHEQHQSLTMLLDASDIYLWHASEARRPGITGAETWLGFAGWVYTANRDLLGQPAGRLL